MKIKTLLSSFWEVKNTKASYKHHFIIDKDVNKMLSFV